MLTYSDIHLQPTKEPKGKSVRFLANAFDLNPSSIGHKIWIMILKNETANEMANVRQLSAQTHG